MDKGDCRAGGDNLGEFISELTNKAVLDVKIIKIELYLIIKREKNEWEISRLLSIFISLGVNRLCLHSTSRRFAPCINQDARSSRFSLENQYRFYTRATPRDARFSTMVAYLYANCIVMQKDGRTFLRTQDDI